MMSAAGEMQFNPGVVAQDIGRLGFIDLLYRHRLALLPAILTSLGQEVRFDVANTRKSGAGLLRNKVAALAILHDGRVRGARCADYCTQGNKQFFTCLHFFAPFFFAVCVVAGGPLCYLHFIACSWGRATWVCVACVDIRPFLRNFLIRVHEEVSQKTVIFDASDASKKLHVQGGAAHAKNRGR